VFVFPLKKLKCEPLLTKKTTYTLVLHIFLISFDIWHFLIIRHPKKEHFLFLPQLCSHQFFLCFRAMSTWNWGSNNDLSAMYERLLPWQSLRSGPWLHIMPLWQRNIGHRGL